MTGSSRNSAPYSRFKMSYS